MLRMSDTTDFWEKLLATFRNVNDEIKFKKFTETYAFLEVQIFTCFYTVWIL